MMSACPAWRAVSSTSVPLATYWRRARAAGSLTSADGGGSVPPMLAAVAPSLGPGLFVGYRNRDQQTTGFEILPTGRVTVIHDAEMSATSTSTPIGDSANRPVALLIGPKTASAAEGIVIAFAGRPVTESFGEATYGVPTGNSVVDLSDSSALLLTRAVGVDRHGQEYEAAIPPDVAIRASPSSDDIRPAATTWLASEAPCTR